MRDLPDPVHSATMAMVSPPPPSIRLSQLFLLLLPCLHRSYGKVSPACKVRSGQLHVYIDELLRGNLQKRERLGGEPTNNTNNIFDYIDSNYDNKYAKMTIIILLYKTEIDDMK